MRPRRCQKGFERKEDMACSFLFADHLYIESDFGLAIVGGSKSSKRPPICCKHIHLCLLPVIYTQCNRIFSY